MKRRLQQGSARKTGSVAGGPSGPLLLTAVVTGLWLISTLACAAETVPAVKAAETAPPVRPIAYETDVRPLLQRYCYECHGNGKSESGLALDAYKTSADVRVAREQWATVLQYVTRHEMPPPDAAAIPSNAEREQIVAFIEKELYQVDPDHPDPGRAGSRCAGSTERNTGMRFMTSRA